MEVSATAVPVSLITTPVYLMSDGSLRPAPGVPGASPFSSPSRPLVGGDLLASSSSSSLAVPQHWASAAPSAASAWSADALARLRYQVNDHVQLLLQTRLIGQWWPTQNAEIVRVQHNTRLMLDEVAALQRLAANQQRACIVDVPMLRLWAFIVEKEGIDGPLQLPAFASLEPESKPSIPLLDDLYTLASFHMRSAQQQQQQQQLQLLDASVRPASLLAAAERVAPLLEDAAVSLPLLERIIAADWNASLRPLLHLRHAPCFTASEDALLVLAFSPPYGVFCSAESAPVTIDWTRVQARYLPAKSATEIRRHFLNVRHKPEDHPFKAVKLKMGVRGSNASLTAAEVKKLEDALPRYPRNAWARMCTEHFPAWDRRALQRAYKRFVRSRPDDWKTKREDEEQMDAAEEEDDAAVTRSSAPLVPRIVPQRSLAPPAMSAAAVSVGSPMAPVTAVEKREREEASLWWSAMSDRLMLQSARSYGSAVEDWPYAVIARLQKQMDGAATASIDDIQQRLLTLIALITQQLQERQDTPLVT